MSFTLTMTRGDERSLSIAVTDSGGSAYNLTGKRLLFTARHKATTISKTTVSGITVTNAAGGLATVLLSPSDTSGFADRVVLACDLQTDDNPASPVTLASGTITVLPDITT